MAGEKKGLSLKDVRGVTVEELRSLAGSLGAGDVSGLNWAQLLQIVIQAILALLGGVTPVPKPAAHKPEIGCGEHAPGALCVLKSALGTAQAAADHASSCCCDDPDDNCPEDGGGTC